MALSLKLWPIMVGQLASDQHKHAARDLFRLPRALGQRHDAWAHVGHYDRDAVLVGVQTVILKIGQVGLGAILKVQKRLQEVGVIECGELLGQFGVNGLESGLIFRAIV